MSKRKPIAWKEVERSLKSVGRKGRLRGSEIITDVGKFEAAWEEIRKWLRYAVCISKVHNAREEFTKELKQCMMPFSFYIRRRSKEAPIPKG